MHLSGEGSHSRFLPKLPSTITLPEAPASKVLSKDPKTVDTCLPHKGPWKKQKC